MTIVLSTKSLVLPIEKRYQTQHIVKITIKTMFECPKYKDATTEQVHSVQCCAHKHKGLVDKARKYMHKYKQTSGGVTYSNTPTYSQQTRSARATS